jgi:hypothetical protein
MVNYLENPVIIGALNNFVVLIISAFALSFLMRGFFFKFLKVKASFGSKILVRIHTQIDRYYTIGIIEDGFLVFRTRTKSNRRVVLPNGAIYRSIGVYWIDVDEEKNCVIKPNMEVVSGFDADRYNSLYLRALYRPAIQDANAKIMMILVVFACLFALGGLIVSAIVMNKTNIVLANTEVMRNFLVNMTISIR